MKIKDVINLGINELKNNNIEESNLKVRMLLSHIIKKDKEYLITHGDDEISNTKFALFLDKLDKLKANMPIQYLTNHQEFMGLDFFVNRNVLIPQPDTECLVEEVIELVRKIKLNKQVETTILDLCTGSGAIAISLSKILKNDVIVYASDISTKALEVVEKNATRNLASIAIIESDLFDNILDKFDIIVSNPPYIETDVIKNLSEEVQKEPILALDGGKDGLKFYREIITKAKDYLNADGYLAFEIGYNQKDKIEKMLKMNEYKNIYAKKDLAGIDRVIIAQK